MKKEVCCKELLASLSDYIDETLSPELRVELEQHLCECHNCKVVLDTTRKTIELYQNCQPGEDCLPEDVKERLLRKLNLEKLNG